MKVDCDSKIFGNSVTRPQRDQDHKSEDERVQIRFLQTTFDLA